MPSCEIIPAAEDWPRYIGIFNRLTVFSPYTLPLSMDLMHKHVIPFGDEAGQICLIGKNRQGEGIIHAGLYAGENIGLIYVLLGDNNNIAEALLRSAEDWLLGKGMTFVRACNWRPNPYKFILHGTETYIWGGSVPAINAFARLHYDLTDESVIMICKMAAEPAVQIPEQPGLQLIHEDLLDDDLVKRGKFTLMLDDKKAGSCTYDYLKAISAFFGKPTGQIAIGIDGQLFGKGLGQALLLSAHRELYRLGARQVMLHTVQRLFRAIKLYEKVGYTEQNIRGYCYERELAPEPDPV